MDNLATQRQALIEEEYNTYDPDYFPGSKGWMRNKAARTALSVFDTAHPEIVLAVESRRMVAATQKYNDLSDFVKAGS